MKATEDGWGMATLAKLLNISYDRVQLWAKRGLKSKKVATNIRSIFQKDLKAFAQAHPERMRGIEFDRLSYAIDDDILARQIVNLKPPTRGYPCKIQRLDTLEIYPSKKAAAHACFLHPSSISIAIALDRPAGEIRFRVLESTKGL